MLEKQFCSKIVLMLKKLIPIFIIVLVAAGFGWVIYDQIFSGGDETTDDVSISQSEAGFWDREDVVAECEIITDNQFCFKDTVWAEQQNEIEFDGFTVVEYTNTSDVIEEISIGTVRLENITPGILAIKDTEPSEIFIDPEQSTRIRYDFTFDVRDEDYDSVKENGIELRSTFTNTVGQKASEVFRVSFNN